MDFEALQERLIPLWSTIGTLTDDDQTIVVLPSINFEDWILSRFAHAIPAYEERFLFLLLLLRQPNARLVYITSEPAPRSVIDYYLRLIPGVDRHDAEARLTLLSPLDPTPVPLAQKVLERPRLMARIRAAVADPSRAHLAAFSVTDLERQVALELGIPVYGADPRFAPLGTKSGARRLFAEVGIPHPAGVGDLRSVDDIVTAVVEMRAEQPARQRLLLKLDNGVSGEGNVSVDLSGLPAAGDPGERSAVAALASSIGEDFLFQLDEGAVVEEMIEGADFRSPSVQLRVTPLREVEMLSTHDQVLGGPLGQSYVGCRFPADSAYASLIAELAMPVGKRLADLGVLGRFAVDFVVTRDQGIWKAYAIEINLRKGGTTHPLLTLQWLTDGSYDASSSSYTTAAGEQRCYVAVDRLENPTYRCLTPEDLFELSVSEGLDYDRSTQTGVVFHMARALPVEGRVGLTAIGRTPEHAQELYERTAELLDRACSAT